MEVNRKPFVKVFEDKQRLEVPLFQRQYCWSEEQQWQPLWEDIKRKFEEAFQEDADEKADELPQHFLGAVILDQKQTPTGHVVVRQVIDGQQRLTTMQIFISVYRDFCRENGCEELAGECERYLENSGMMEDRAVDKFKIWPTQSDRDQFKDVIESGSKEEIEKRYPLAKTKRARKQNPRPSMVEAYLFFYARLFEFFNGDENAENGAPFRADLALAARVEKCFQALCNSLMIVIIDLDKSDDPQIIFETLNARGEPLLPADLVRNYVFSRAKREDLNVEENYRKYWAKFDEEFWRKPVRQGRLTRPRSDLFMQHFLASQYVLAGEQARDIPMKRLYAEYRHWIEKEEPFDNVSEELETVGKFRDYFHRLMSPNAEGGAISVIGRVLRDFNVGTAYPLLLVMMERTPKAEWSGIIKALESYIVRRSVCQLTGQNYNLRFMDLALELSQEDFSAKNFGKALSSKTGESVLWPDDVLFRNAWMKGEIYNKQNSDKLVYILTRLNEAFMSPKSESINLDFDEKPSVEHILPQKWQEHWLLPDGSAGLTKEELEEADESDSRLEATERRDKMLNTIGNLTLLSKPLNSAQSNLPWETKQPEMLKHSVLPINSVLQGETVWDEEAILRRGADLFERALKIWPR